MGLAGHSKERTIFFGGEKSYVGFTACYVLTFGKVCAVVSVHVDVWQVVPVAFLPFTLCAHAKCL